IERQVGMKPVAMIGCHPAVLECDGNRRGVWMVLRNIAYARFPSSAAQAESCRQDARGLAACHRRIWGRMQIGTAQRVKTLDSPKLDGGEAGMIGPQVVEPDDGNARLNQLALDLERLWPDAVAEYQAGDDGRGLARSPFHGM